jgi:competence protein ComEA
MAVHSGAVLVLILTSAAAAFGQQVLPDGPGKELTQSKCGTCHSVQILAAQDQTRDEWSDTINKMMGMGAQMTEEEFNSILDYVATNFPPKVRVNRATAERIAKGLDLAQTEAEAIVHYRQQNGNFKSFDDLLKVPGLDAKKMAERRKLIAF